MYSLPPLPYPYDALEPFIDAQTTEIHHDKHHAAYVDNLNKALESHPELSAKPIEELLKNLNAVPEDIRTKVRNHGGGHANHSFFWQVMGPVARLQTPDPKSPFITAMMSSFSTPETMKEKFIATAQGHFGSGWVWLVANKGKIEIVDTANQDSPLSEGKAPLLAIDVWEHAYYLKYQNRRAEYIEAWWNIINWSQIEKNFQEATK